MGIVADCGSWIPSMVRQSQNREAIIAEAVLPILSMHACQDIRMNATA